MAGVEGLEPPTLGLEIRCSIRLSYTPARSKKYYHTLCAGGRPQNMLQGNEEKEVQTTGIRQCGNCTPPIFI